MNIAPVALLTLLFAVDTAVAATFVVNTIIDAPDATPDGICAAAGSERLCTLRAAVQEATGSPQMDTVWLPAGIYQLTIPVNESALNGASGGLSASGLTIQGAGREATVIDGGALDVVVKAGGEVTIANLTVRNGRGVSPEPLVYRHGGGIYNSGRLTLRDVTVRDNVAGIGAGLANGQQATMIVEGSTITSNTALVNSAGGAGIYNSGTLIVRNSTISDNRIVPNSGGTEFTDGSGLTNHRGTFHLTNVTISGNRGGAIYSASLTTSTLSNVTIAGNISSYPAAAAISISTYREQDSDATGTYIVRNSIIAGNDGGNCIGRLVSAGYNIEDDGSCNFVTDGSSRVADPGISALGPVGGLTFTHGLWSGSAAVDAGDPNGCTDNAGPIVTDQRGGPRAVSTNGGTPRCDVGAFELGAPIAVAGVRRRVNPGTLVRLDGLLSQGYSGAPTYTWTQIGGDNVTLSADQFFATFNAPATAQPLTFELSVTDNTVIPATGTARVTIEVNSPPVSNAGSNFTVAPSTPVTLNGTASNDADGNISYAWTQTGGPSVTLTGATTTSPTFIAPASGPLTFQLTVTDGDGMSHSSTVVTNIVLPTPAGSSTGGGGGGGGGAIGPLLIAALGLLKASRRKRRAR